MKKLEKIRKGLVEVWVFNVNVGVAGADGLQCLAFSFTVLRFLSSKVTVLRFFSF